MNERKYSVVSVGPKIDEFLDPVLDQAGFDLDYEIADVESGEADFETPDIVVRFSGQDVDLLLGNRAHDNRSQRAKQRAACGRSNPEYWPTALASAL